MSIDSPVGRIALTSNDTHLKSVAFSEEEVEESDTLPEILLQSAAQLKEYFAGTRTVFDLEIDPDGSAFQKNVWQRLLLVPYGLPKSYHDIAVELGSALYSMAVGTAHGKNQIPFIVPCHRIIGHDGKLVGYAGGIERKRFLLLHDAEHSKKDLLF